MPLWCGCGCVCGRALVCVYYFSSSLSCSGFLVSITFGKFLAIQIISSLYSPSGFTMTCILGYIEIFLLRQRFVQKLKNRQKLKDEKSNESPETDIRAFAKPSEVFLWFSWPQGV